MSGDIDIVTLLAILVTVVIVIKLRSALGRRTSDEDQARYERQARAREAREQAAAAGDKVVTLPSRQREESADYAAASAEPEKPAQERIQARSADGIAAEKGLLAIAERDTSFDAEHFVTGAKQAYEMIVTAFAEGNRDLLRELLSEEVFVGFDGAIDDRESRGEQIDQSFVGINKCHIIDAELSGPEASVTLKFLSQLITSTRDKDGNVLAGDPQRIQEVTDIWTFARDVTSPNPNWRLVATQASQ